MSTFVPAQGSFRRVTTYLNDSDQPMGARYTHPPTGFTLDVIQIPSVPQAVISVSSPPVSDKGEPHTQEHLLLGKGARGRRLSGFQTMTLTTSTAATYPLETLYHFNSPVAGDAFFDEIRETLEALLKADYSDEEIRREVRHLAVEEGKDKKLRLEEKGTIYQEMVSTAANPGYRVYRELNRMLYGMGHPHAYDSGGSPAQIRHMTPEDIKRFRDANYHLANMTMVLSIPPSMKVERALTWLDTELRRLQGSAPLKPVSAKLPPAHPAAAGTITIVDYPSRNEQQPVNVQLAFPPDLELAAREETLLSLFLSNFASDPTTNLHKLFVASATRKIDLGARGVYAYSADTQPGNPVFVGLNNVAPANLTVPTLEKVRQMVLDELNVIAAWPADSAELREFNTRLRSRIVQSRRGVTKMIDSPPGFGSRNGSGAYSWLNYLRSLNKTPAETQSLTSKPEFAWVEEQMARSGNIWAEWLPKWKLTGRQPFVIAGRPSTALMEREAKERDERMKAETAALAKRYGLLDEQEALRRYKQEFDAATAALEAEEKKATLPKFMDKPPMTLDEELQYKQEKVAGNVPLFFAAFDNMRGASANVALRLDGVRNEDLVLLAALPGLLTSTGVIRDGQPVPYEKMSEALKNEILSLNASFSTNRLARRVELVVRGAGNDAQELDRAIGWLDSVLKAPYWRKENLARIRDVVDQLVAQRRNAQQGPEEAWVNNPVDSWRDQRSPLLMATGSMMTQAHDVHRLRWLLKDAGADPERIAAWFDGVGASKGKRDDFKKLAAELSAGKAESQAALSAEHKALSVEAGKDLAQLLTDLPNNSLEADWRYLCQQMKRDLLTSPEATLARLDRLRQDLLRTPSTRVVFTGSTSMKTSALPKLEKLLAGFAKDPAPAVARESKPLIAERLRTREPQAAAPVYIGYVAPNMQGGVLNLRTPAGTWDQASRDDLLNYTASKIMSGAGAHGFFMRTWSSGLAYSNGIGGSPSGGELRYYAERTPELPLTMKFVIGETQKMKPTPELTEYALAQVFNENRAAGGFEGRGEAMAADLVDGRTPDKVRSFRQKALDLRKIPNLTEELFARMKKVYAPVLPGLIPGTVATEQMTPMVLGNDKQLDAWQEYLKTAVSAETKLWRLYARDYWRVD